MKIEYESEQDSSNPTLKQKVTEDSELKSFLVTYVGNKKQPTGDAVTVEMVVDVLTEEFPELVLSLAEENWIRGYHQAFHDIEATAQVTSEKKDNEQ